MALQVDSYHVSSVTHGEDAQGQASVTARVDGSELTGSGTSTDILEASALAWLEVANRVTRTRQPQRRAATACGRTAAQDPARQPVGCPPPPPRARLGPPGPPRRTAPPPPNP